MGLRNSPSRYPDFIESVILSTRFTAGQYSSYSSFNVLDDQDKEELKESGLQIKDGEVVIWQIIPGWVSIVSEERFCRAVYGYGSMLIEICKNHSINRHLTNEYVNDLNYSRLIDKWVNEMKSSLKKLKQKIDQFPH
jgi:hypothetical protein